MTVPIRDRIINAEEFLALPETTQPMQLLGGEIVVSPAPLIDHQRIIRKLINHFNSRVTIGEFILAPADVYLDDEYVTQPDIFWVNGAESQCQPIKGRYWRGAPEFIIEVLSPSTARYDRGVKFEQYEQHGVQEYWLIDPDAMFVEVYQRHENQFVRIGVFGSAEPFKAQVFADFEFNPAVIFGEQADESDTAATKPE